MYYGNHAIIEEVYHLVNLPVDDNKQNRICFIKGMFGSGKSFLLNELSNVILSSKIADSVIIFSDDNKIRFLSDFTAKLLKGMKNIPGGFNPVESNYNAVRLNEMIKDLRAIDFYLFEKLFSFLYLRSNAELLANDELMYPESFFNEKKEIISKFYPKKGEQRLLLESDKLTAESLIVDLMSHFYSDIGNNNIYEDRYSVFTENLADSSGNSPAQNEFISFSNPKKIIFFIDNYDSISGNVNRWLIDTLFSYCFEKKFSEFECFNINFLDREYLVSRFFDIRFVIASREDIPDVFIQNKNSYIKSLMTEFELRLMDSDEILKYYTDSHIKIEDSIEFVQELTKGIPYIVFLLAEYLQIGVNESDYTLIYNLTAEKILKSYDDVQKDWIRCAAFLQDFDESGLACFPMIGNKSASAFKFFMLSPSLTEKTDNGRLQIRPIISEFIRNAIKVESRSTANKFEQIAYLYYKSENYLSGLDIREKSFVKRLSYFKCFDKDIIIPAFFGDDFLSVNNLLDNHEELFIKNHHFYALKDEIYDVLSHFCKFVDVDSYFENKKAAESIWDEFSGRLLQEITYLYYNIDSLFTDKEEIEDLQKVQIQNKNNISSNIDEVNKNINALKSKSDDLKNKGRFANSSIFGFITIFLISVGLIFHFNLFNYELNQYIVYSVFGLSFIGLSLWLGKLFKIIAIRFNKKEFLSIQSEISVLYRKNDELLKENEAVIADLREYDYKILEINREISEKEIALVEMNEKLENAFI